MPKISIRLDPDKHQALALSAQKENKSVSDYVRELLLLDSPPPNSNLEAQMTLYIITRLQLLTLAQSMPPDQVMLNYDAIKQDATTKFAGVI